MVALLDEVRSALADLIETLETASDSAEVLDAVCAEAVRVVPGADMASITVIDCDGARTAACSDQRAATLDLAQYEAGDGPCLRAAATGETVRLSLETASELWPKFTASAEQGGVGSYLAAPLRVDSDLSGAINLFGFGDHGFAETDSTLLGLYVTVVTFGLRTIRRYQQVRDLADHLEAAMRSRAEIEQAKGILMATYKISADEAIRRLIAYSQDTNTKLRVVAVDFVRKASTPTASG
nr:hypothetical protein [Kibdelosporangium sp. MJ126-NF4]CTQ88502.1 hypothetical protein [Kibdelosporangium sp. MJ126-NF4]